jgi:hypothetical protein
MEVPLANKHEKLDYCRGKKCREGKILHKKNKIKHENCSKLFT